MTAVGFRPGDRVAVRDAVWRIEAVEELGDGRALLSLLPAEPNGHGRLPVVVPPDRVTPLPTEELSFDLKLVSPIGPWLWAHRALALTCIKDASLTGARYGRVALEAYQVAPVLRILSKPSPRLLIADDVGLGKTIEAGLCLLELMYRRRAERVLIVVPPGLIPQWLEEELLDRFGLVFTAIENASGLANAQTDLPAGVSPWELPRARIITSMDYLKKDEVRRRALAKPWDLVIVDEAHALGESGTTKNPYRTRRTRLGEELSKRSRGLLLLTATPHNGYLHSFRSLIELVEPTAATLVGDQVSDRIDRAMIRRMKRQITMRGPDGKWIPRFLPRHVEPMAVSVTAEERKLFELITAYCSRTVREATIEEADLISFAMQIIKKRAISSRRALRATLDRRLEALEKEDEQEEKPDRVELRDFQASLPIPDAEAERLARRILRSAIPKEERRRRTEVQKIKEIRRLLKKLPEPDPKIELLMGHLKVVFAEDPTAKVIVFTEYLDTLESIRLTLEADQAGQFKNAYAILRGGLGIKQRRAVQKRFEDPDVRILLATDAASEGLNLQKLCHRVVHVELPWNPNRLEQRNGRIDRYGQTQNPIIRYLFYPDSPEDDVLRRLVEKMEEIAKGRVSTPDALGIITGLGIDQRLTELETKVEGDQLVRDFDDRTEEFIKGVRPLLVPHVNPQEEIESAEHLLQRAEPLLPDDLELERLLAAVLGPQGLRPTKDDGIVSVEVPRRLRGPGVRERYERATCRRSIAAATSSDQVEYLTPLHPLIEAMSAEARRRFVQVYPDERGLTPRRLASRRVHSGGRQGILFTFLGEILGPTEVIEEQVVPVSVDPDGRPMGSADTDLALLSVDSEPGEVAPEQLEVFQKRFPEMATAAREEARRRMLARAVDIRQARQKQAEILLEDAETYRADRLEEIHREETEARLQVERTGQLVLLVADERVRYGGDARRAAVESYLKERRDELAVFATVDEPAAPRPLGALFLVPASA